MTRATKFRDGAHARVFASWENLPAWQLLSGSAAKLLCAMLFEYRPAYQGQPGNNGMTDWPAARAGRAVGRSKATGARLLLELTEKGWLEIVRLGQFQAKPSRYALTIWPNDATGEPNSHAYKHWQPPFASRKNETG